MLTRSSRAASTPQFSCTGKHVSRDDLRESAPRSPRVLLAPSGRPVQGFTSEELARQQHQPRAHAGNKNLDATLTRLSNGNEQS